MVRQNGLLRSGFERVVDPELDVRMYCRQTSAFLLEIVRVNADETDPQVLHLDHSYVNLKGGFILSA